MPISLETHPSHGAGEPHTNRTASTNNRKLPKIPIFSLINIRRIRKRIETTLLRDFSYSACTGDNISSLILALSKLLPRVSKEVICKATEILIGECLTPEIIALTARRIAGNYHRLLAGKSNICWTVQEEPEWMLLQITGVRPTKEKDVYEIIFNVVAGSGATKFLVVRWPLSRILCVAKLLGFDRQNGKFPLSHPAQLFGLFCVAFFEPARCLISLKFTESTLTCTRSLRETNRQLIKTRFRKYASCPRYFLHDCQFCWVGFNSCERAVHL